MTIHAFSEAVAQAKTNAIGLDCSVAEAATALAKWQAKKRVMLVPQVIDLDDAALGEAAVAENPDQEFFRLRAQRIRVLLAQKLKLSGRLGDAQRKKLSFLIRGKQAWFLAPRVGLTAAAMQVHAANNPAIYLQLILQKEMVESAALDVIDTKVLTEYGPGVHLLHVAQDGKRTMQLAEVCYDVNDKRGMIVCNVRAQTFFRTRESEQESLVMPTESGRGQMVEVVKVARSGVRQADARRNPMTGISLNKKQFRRTRLYYLNVITDFAEHILSEAGVPLRRELFAATHFVANAFIPADSVTSLHRPLAIVDAYGGMLSVRALRPFLQMEDYIGQSYHVRGKHKAKFEQPVVIGLGVVPDALDPQYSYLFLNGEDTGSGTVRIASDDQSGKVIPASEVQAYACIERDARAVDPYTQLKYRHVVNATTFDLGMQGLNATTDQLMTLKPVMLADQEDGVAANVREKIKRCLIELSLKECLTQEKSLVVDTIPAHLLPSRLTLLATRRIKVGRKLNKQLVSCVRVAIDAKGICVRDVCKSPWEGDQPASIRLVGKYPFLATDGQQIRDKQFWALDETTGERLMVWSGNFIPKIVLNGRYRSIEDVLQMQDVAHLEESASGKRLSYYSKNRCWNLLPYYISAFDSALVESRFANGQVLPFEDRGAFLRLFVPTADGIAGQGGPLSCLRDLVLFDAGGQSIASGLLDSKLVQLYLHTMTAGILVGGNNSKMSILEKLARIPLDN
jgi:hypothetical protein